MVLNRQIGICTYIAYTYMYVHFDVHISKRIRLYYKCMYLNNNYMYVCVHTYIATLVHTQAFMEYF